MFANTYMYNDTEYMQTPMGRVEYQSNENIRANLQEALVISNHLCSKTFPPCKLSFIPWLQTQNRPVLKRVLPLCSVWLCSVQHWFKSMSQKTLSYVVTETAQLVYLWNTCHSPRLYLGGPKLKKIQVRNGPQTSIIAISFWRQSFYENMN